MKKRIKTLLAALCCIGVCACASKGDNENSFKRANMSEYELLEDEDHVFYDSDVLNFKEGIEKGETFVAYFGFANCPWCKEAVPVLNEAVKTTDYKIAYINTRKNPEWKSNIDIDNYDELVDLVGDYLDYDEEGIKHMYTPFVVFVKNGEIVGCHEGTLEGHSPSEAMMTQEQRTELLDIYEKLIS